MKFLKRAPGGARDKPEVAPANAGARVSGNGLFAVDIEGEVLGHHLLVLAIGADGVNRCAQACNVRTVAFTHRDPGASAEVFRVVDVRPHQSETFTYGGFDKALIGVDDVGEGGVQAT